MKLTVTRNKNGITGYTIFINKSEAESSGFVDADGNSMELIKEVDPKGEVITIKKNIGYTSRIAIKSKFLRANLDALKAGKNIKTARNDHYILRGNTLFKQKHQAYLRGEEPSPYAEFAGGVFYGLTDDTEVE